MTRLEAAILLGHAKFSMPFIEAGMAEDYEGKLYRGLSVEQAHQLADSVLPRGRLGRVRLVLYPPTSARATAFIAAVLRSIEEDKNEAPLQRIYGITTPR